MIVFPVQVFIEFQLVSNAVTEKAPTASVEGGVNILFMLNSKLLVKGELDSPLRDLTNQQDIIVF